MTDILIGADPEFFIQQRRHFLSAHELPFGTKKEPLQTEHGAVQVDGTALEINVVPAVNKKMFIQRIKATREDLNSLLQEHLPGAKIVARPSIFFGRTKIAQLPPNAALLGCDADYNAYTKTKNQPPNSSLPFRTGAGHIHIGWGYGYQRTPEHMELCARITRELDYYLGLPSLLWDKDSRRRELYGQAGAFRPKQYGVEYRVLSNKWTETDKLVGWVFDRAVLVVKKVLAGKPLLSDAFEYAAQVCINANDTEWREAYPAIAEEVLQ